MRRKIIFILFILSMMTLFSFCELEKEYFHSIDIFPNLSILPELDWWETWDNGDGDKAFDIAIDSEDNIFVVGETDVGNVYDIVLLKYNSSGSLIWNKTWDSYDYERPYAIALDTSGNIYVTGKSGPSTSLYDVFLAKFNNEGQVQWSRYWGGPDLDYGYDVAIDSEGNIFVTGLTYTPTSSDICLLKYDNMGNYQWNRTFGDITQFDSGYGLSINNNTDDIYLVGQIGIYDGGGDVFISKFNNQGIQQWNASWGAGINHQVATDVVFYSYDSIYITGEDAGDSLVMKYNDTGDLQWSKTWGGVYTECGRRLVVDNDENIFITGYSGVDYSYDIFILKYNIAGILQWEKVWYYTHRAEGEGIALDSEENVYVVGWTTSPWDAVILKYIQYPPGDFLLTTNASIPHLDDKFILTWNPSERAKSYSVYKYDKYITSINDSVILLKDNIVENNYLVSNLTRGDWFFIVVAFNPLGNISSDCINISIVLPLDIIINDPISDELFGNTPPNFNITIIGRYKNTTWYTLDSGSTNCTFKETDGMINQSIWDDQPEGIATIRFYANNSFSNISYNEISVRKDTLTPNISISDPLLNELFGNDPPFYIISIDEINLDIWGYTFDNITSYTITNFTGYFNLTAWQGLDNGTVLITFFAIDKAGNMNSSYVVVRKDSNNPDIIILSPDPGEIFGDMSPEFNISIFEDDLIVSTWYTVEGSTTQYPFTGVTGTISQEVWENLVEGQITITFYAQDRAGNIGNESIIVIKSIPAPPTGISGIIPGIIGSVSAILVISLIIWAIFNQRKRKKSDFF